MTTAMDDPGTPAESHPGETGSTQIPDTPQPEAGLPGFELPRRGRGESWFIAFEGSDGSGKSTQATLLARRTGALLTRQPGGTRLGEVLRDLTLGGSAGEVTDRAEALLMAADRAQHVELVIRPTLDSGRSVICDRYIGSSIAYQGHSRGLDPETVERISLWACDGLLPDVVIYLRVDHEESRDRTGSPRDRIEASGEGFHERVRSGFDSLAETEPSWVTVDGKGSIQEVAQRVEAAVLEYLERR